MFDQSSVTAHCFVFMSSLLLFGIILGCVSIVGLVGSFILGMRLLRFQSVFGACYLSAVLLYLLAMILNTMIYWPEDQTVKRIFWRTSQVLSNCGTLCIFSAMLYRYREFMPAITFLLSFGCLTQHVRYFPFVAWMIALILFLQAQLESFHAFLPSILRNWVANSTLILSVYVALLDILMSVHLIYMMYQRKVSSTNTSRLKGYLIMVLTGNFIMLMIGVLCYMFASQVDPSIRAIHPYTCMSAATIGIYITLTSLFLILFRNCIRNVKQQQRPVNILTGMEVDLVTPVRKSDDLLTASNDE
jgi:hypothetical protein